LPPAAAAFYTADMDLLAYLITGAFAGLIAGLLGVGGGLVIVPVLAFLFVRAGFEPGVVMHLAVGTSLATIVFTSISSVRAHHRHGAVRWPVFWQLTPGIIVGALLGAWLAGFFATDGLRLFFALFEIGVALQLAFGMKPRAHASPGAAAGSAWEHGLAGTVIGAVSALVGIGGGTLTVPWLVWRGTPMRNAVAISSACGLPIATAGAVGFILTGWQVDTLPAQSLGYIYLPAFVGIVVTSVLFAPLGARLAHRLPVVVLKRFFAGFLMILGIRMLYGL